MKYPFDLLATGVRDAFHVRQPAADPESCARAAAEWLRLAHDRCDRGGVSYGYSLRGGWRPAYVETSGYIASTFFELGRRLGDADWTERAVRICEWLCEAQNEDGSFPNPHLTGPGGVVFDTGQDLHGLVCALEHAPREAFLDAATRAADWLVRVGGDSGVWRRSTFNGIPHVYNARVAWALLRLAALRPRPEWERTALVNLEWGLTRRRGDLFEDCAFETGAPPYTHTIAYALRGYLESGALLGEERYVDAARGGARQLARLLRDDGYLPARVDVEGRPAATYVCLTGNCQMAIVWAKLAGRDGDHALLDAATRALDFVRRRQDLRAANPNVRGAVPGSWPIWGRYSRFTYPNWATKFFLDAMQIVHGVPS